MRYKAVAFDLFGTLVRRTYKSTCYRDLFWRLEIDQDQGAQLAMMKNLGLSQFAEDLIPGHGLDLSDLENDLLKDLDNIMLYDDSLETLEMVRERGLKIALISNLAQPYAERVLQLLTQHCGFSFDAVAFSCEVGMLKPHSRIFNAVSRQLQISPDKILIVGNSNQDDIIGAKNAGMESLYLDRKGWSGYGVRTINTLLQGIQFIDTYQDATDTQPIKKTATGPAERPFLIFLDTEFSDFSVRKPRLISIGLVAENGRTFYAELTDTWERHHCSVFVKQNVLPLLEGGTYRMTAQNVQQRLIAWIESFQLEVKIVTDAPDFDWQLLTRLFDIYRPVNLHPAPTYFTTDSFRDCSSEIIQAMESALDGLPPHHALRDAMQLKAACDLLKMRNHPHFGELYSDYAIID